MKTTDDRGLPMSLKIIAAGLAGCTADLATFPFDTIKVWLQVRGEATGKAYGNQAAPGAMVPEIISQKLALSQPAQKRGVHFSASALSDPKNYTNSGTKGGRNGLLPVRISSICSPGSVTRHVVANLSEMTASKIYVLKKKAMGQHVIPAARIDDALSTAVKLKANATQTFNELTLSELYMAQKRAAKAAARTSKKVSSGAIQTVMENVKRSGARSLYSGLVAGLQRQIGFCSVRIGFYDNIKQFYVQYLPAAPDSKLIGQRILAGATSGILAVCLFQPTEVVKIRMQAERGRYNGTFQAYRALYKSGGIAEVWKGVDANCARTAVVNICELVTYDMVKEAILKRKLMADNFPCHVVSAVVAGLVTTVFANPIDVVKTRYMNSEKGTYANPMQCAARTMKSEGMTAFYKGFLPSYVRIGLWSLVMFVSYEQYKKYFKDIASSTPEFPLPHMGTPSTLLGDAEIEAELGYPSYVEAIFHSQHDSGPMT